MTNKSALKKNLFRLIILTLGAIIIYGLPYFRYAYWTTFMDVFNLNDSQMANLQTAYGVMALISYLPGGWLADKIAVKKLLLFSIFSTAFSGLFLLTIPSYEVILVIHGFWGVSTILTFWPAFVKTVRSLSNDDEQGKAFGLMEGMRGVFNIGISTAALAIFGLFLSNSAADGIAKVILFYSVLLVLIGILIMIFVKEVKKEKIDNEEKIDKAEQRKIIIKELKKPTVWIISGIVFCSYFMNIVFYNFTPYAEKVLGVGPVFAGFMVIFAQWVRPLAAISAGVLGDKIGITKTVQIGFSLITLGTLAVFFIPSKAPIALFITAIGVIYIAMYALQANHFALLEEGKIDKRATGMAVGVVSTLGYLPEVIGSQVALMILTRFGVENGGTLSGSYHVLFAFLICLFVVGLLLTIIWSKVVMKKQVN